jgi:hypothetical protein
MALAFPSSPTVNQTYTSGTRTWTWNGTAWKLPSTALTGVTGTGNAVLSVGPTITLANATGLPLTTGVTGVLPAANGGTSLSSPGTSGNVLTSNGTTWTSATPGGGTPTLVIVSATTQTAIKGNHYVLTHATTTTLTLPASPTVGDIVYVTSGNLIATNVIAFNGNAIMGLMQNLTIDTANYITIQLRYINATIGWVTL